MNLGGSEPQSFILKFPKYVPCKNCDPEAKLDKMPLFFQSLKVPKRKFCGLKIDLY